MQNELKIIFVFVDGLGIGSDDPAVNPIQNSRYPNLCHMISQATPLDACLGIKGLPQSATGQAALLTGINAAEKMGRHIEGFPPPALKTLIQQENLFSKLCKAGKECTFINAYWMDDPTQIPPRRQSVTTVMTLSALAAVRGKSKLESNRAVNHDITRWTLHERGYEGPVITPEEAADHLVAEAQKHHFTLFEYFLTDRAGHSGDTKLVHHCLDTLERFLTKLSTFAMHPNHLFLLCSDHGNIEDLSTRTHTKNPVPLIAIGKHAERFEKLKNLTDITPAILKILSEPR